MIYCISIGAVPKARATEGFVLVDTIIRSGRLDRLAIAISGLCLVHCVASLVLVATMASLGGVLLDPIFHEVGLVLAIGIGVVALGWGYREHGRVLPVAIGGLGLGVMTGALSLGHGVWEVPLTIAGVSLLALAHILNRKAVI